MRTWRKLRGSGHLLYEHKLDCADREEGPYARTKWSGRSKLLELINGAVSAMPANYLFSTRLEVRRGQWRSLPRAKAAKRRAII